jgi:hypothetical protein
MALGLVLGHGEKCAKMHTFCAARAAICILGTVAHREALRR